MFSYFRRIYAGSVPKNVRENFNKISLMYLINGIFFGCYNPYWGIIARERFHAAAFWIALVFASQYIYGILSLIIAGFVPKGQEPLYAKYIRISASIFLILSVFMKTGPLFCLMLFVFHVTACYVLMDNTIFAYIFPIDIRSRMLGYAKMIYSLTSMIVTLLAGMFINITFFGFPLWKAFFILGGISLACCGFIMGKIKIQSHCEEKENPIKFFKDSFRLLKTDRFNITLIISGIFFTVGFNMFSTLFPIYQVDALRISTREVSVITVAGSIGLIFAYPLLGSFFSKMNPVKGWLWVYPFIVIYPLFYVFAGNSWYPLIIGYVLNQLFIVTNDIAWINLIIYLGGKEKIKEYQGLYAFFIGVRALIGLFVSSFIITQCEKMHFSIAVNLKIAFLWGIGFCFVSLLFMLPLLKQIRKKI